MTRGTPLDRSAIVRAALAIVDAAGVEGLSMRRVARRLGVAPMSLYRHVRDKAELLDLVVEAVAEMVSLPDPRLAWDDRIVALCTSIRELLLDHPGLARLLPSRIPLTPAVLRVSDALLAALADAGLGDQDAAVVHEGLWMLTLGTVLIEQSMAEAFPTAELLQAEWHRMSSEVAAVADDSLPALAAAAPHWAELTPDQTFATALLTMLDGIRARASRR